MSDEHSNGAAGNGNGRAAAPSDNEADGFLEVGLALQALGATLVATERLAGKADRDKRKAVLASTIPVVSGIIGDLEILRLGLKRALGMR